MIDVMLYIGTDRVYLNSVIVCPIHHQHVPWRGSVVSAIRIWILGKNRIEILWPVPVRVGNKLNLFILDLCYMLAQYKQGLFWESNF